MMDRLQVERILALILLIALFLIPVTANAQGGNILTLITNIIGTLRNTVGPVLNEVQTINNTVRNLQQQVVWPQTLINQTKGFVSQMRSQFASLAAQIHSMPKSSATLANPSQLETVMRSGQASNVSQLQSAFTRLYSAVPQASDAAASERNLIDADDAAAVGSLKTAMISDQKSEQMLAAAAGLEQQVAVAAPGSASLLTVQAQAANLGSQAFLHRMLAADLRQEAAKLAHENVLRKRSAEATKALRDHMQQILSRP